MLELYIWNTLKTDELKVLYSTIPNRIQAGVKKCEMTCQIFTRNEVSSKIKCYVVIVLNMNIDKKTRSNNDLHLLICCNTRIKVHKVCR